MRHALKLVLIVFALVAALAQDAAAPMRIPPIYTSQMTVLQAQMEILRLQVCSDAGIPYLRCTVNWQAGIVSADPKPKPQVP